MKTLLKAILTCGLLSAAMLTVSATQKDDKNNINYKDCRYVGLTHANVDDTYIIEYGNERLKVLYVNPKGRYN